MHLTHNCLDRINLLIGTIYTFYKFEYITINLFDIKRYMHYIKPIFPKIIIFFNVCESEAKFFFIKDLMRIMYTQYCIFNVIFIYICIIYYMSMT